MSHPRVVIAALVAGLSLCPPDALAESRIDKGWAFVDVGGQGAMSAFSISATPRIYAEAGSLTSQYSFKTAPQVNVGAGVRLWRQLGVGASFSFTSQTDTAGINAQIPHPFFFNQLRQVSGSQSGLTRREAAVHVLAQWRIPLGARVYVALEGGPSFIAVRQDVVDAFSFSESYPYDTAVFGSATTAAREKSAVGFNAGADVGYMFQRHIGAGGAVRFVRAHTTLEGAGASTGVDLGGVQYGGGLRVRF